MALPRMRTAKGMMDELKAIDPNTCVTLYYLRRLVKSGKIPVVRAGAKILVDVNTVLEYLERGDGAEDDFGKRIS